MLVCLVFLDCTACTAVVKPITVSQSDVEFCVSVSVWLCQCASIVYICQWKFEIKKFTINLLRPLKTQGVTVGDHAKTILRSRRNKPVELIRERTHCRVLVWLIICQNVAVLRYQSVETMVECCDKLATCRSPERRCLKCRQRSWTWESRSLRETLR